MPVISLFFGIVIRMFYREHGIAHFHAEYQGQQATLRSTERFWLALSSLEQRCISFKSGL